MLPDVTDVDAVRVEDTELDILVSILPVDTSIDLKKVLPLHLQNWISENTHVARDLALKHLNKFLQNNWTGPPSTNQLHEEFRDRALIYLGDVEPAYSLCYGPENLVIALVIFHYLNDRPNTSFYDAFCLLQAYWIQQCLEEEKSINLKTSIAALITKMHDLPSKEIPKKLMVQFLTSSAHILSFYSDHLLAEKLLSEALSLTNVLPSLTGILGKRTRFQEIEYAQLVVSLQGPDIGGNISNDAHQSQYPPNVPIEDETLLEEIQLSQQVPFAALQDYETVLLLSEALFLQRRRAPTELLEEEILAYLEVVLKSNPPYAVKASALYHRCKYEVNKSRKSIRAMQQLESLITSFHSSFPDCSSRLEFCIAANLPPVWKIQEELGFVLLKNGCTSDAVNIFTDLKLWEDVIECYQRIGQKVKAEDLILKELDKQQTPSLWCRLGDIREDVECYEQAWDLSKHRSANSRQQLGNLYVKRKQYAEAVEVLRQGLKINATHPGLWFTLGYSLIKTERHAEAEVAFRRCVNLDPENSLAWNNLGSLALRNKDYPKAFRILQDSIKADYDNWNVWDNYQNACQHVKDYEEEIKALYRLLELRGRLNSGSLSLLVAAVLDGTLDIRGLPASRLFPTVKELFGGLTAKVPDDYKIWALYATLQLSEIKNKKENYEKKELLFSVVQKLQRAHRYVTRIKAWEKEEHTLIDALTIARELSKAQLMLESVEKDEMDKLAIKSSIRVMLDNVVTRVEKFYEDPISRMLNIAGDALPIFDELLKIRSLL